MHNEMHASIDLIGVCNFVEYCVVRRYFRSTGISEERDRVYFRGIRSRFEVWLGFRRLAP